MSLTKLDKILDINPETRIAKCQSGVRIHDLCDALAPHGLAVGTLGTIDWQVSNISCQQDVGVSFNLFRFKFCILEILQRNDLFLICKIFIFI